MQRNKILLLVAALSGCIEAQQIPGDGTEPDETDPSTSPRVVDGSCVEIGTGEKVSESAVKLSGSELAARLSYALWDSPPNDKLNQAVAAGELGTKEGVAAQLAHLRGDRGAAAADHDYGDDQRAEFPQHEFVHALREADVGPLIADAEVAEILVPLLAEIRFQLVQDIGPPLLEGVFLHKA